MAASETVLVIALELLGVALLTLVAGISDEMGKIVVLFMAGFWLIYVITDSAVISRLGNILSGVATEATKQ